MAGWNPGQLLVQAQTAYSANAMSAKKRKPKPFRAATAVKAAARKLVGTPPATRAEPADSRKPVREKHKPSLQDLIESGNE